MNENKFQNLNNIHFHDCVCLFFKLQLKHLFGGGQGLGGGCVMPTVEDRARLTGVSPLLLSCELQGSSSGCQD